MNRITVLFLWLLTITLNVSAKKGRLTDKNATLETKALFSNLKRLSKTNILFGHQHATEYGHGWTGEADRSDVKSVTGSHPAVVGVDISGLSGRSAEEIERTKIKLQKNVSDTYNRGGLTTVSWHFGNPVTGKDFYWKEGETQPVVQHIIPGGSYHLRYKEILRTVADFAKNTRGADGKVVPMIFRPYHEFDGDWFWWGKSHVSTADFKTLWRFTVSYLRDSLGVHNFIYAFSPDNRFLSEAEYLERYPGDKWVDMLGVDNYGDFGRDNQYNLNAGLKKLQIVSACAKKRGKLAAFTETGLESIPNSTWWTESLLKLLKTKGLQLSYVLVWRNDSQSPTHYYAPYPGHPSVADFLKFYNDPFTLFETDLPRIYKK